MNFYFVKQNDSSTNKQDQIIEECEKKTKTTYIVLIQSTNHAQLLPIQFMLAK